MATPPRHDPTLVTFFLCDQILRDQIGNKWTAIGLYNTLYFPVEAFPLVLSRVWMYVRIADAPPVVDFVATIYSPAGVVVGERKTHFDRRDTPLGGPQDKWWEIGGYFDQPAFPGLGVYRVAVSINGVELGDLSLHMLAMPQRPT